MRELRSVGTAIVAGMLLVVLVLVLRIRRLRVLRCEISTPGPLALPIGLVHLVESIPSAIGSRELVHALVVGMLPGCIHLGLLRLSLLLLLLHLLLALGDGMLHHLVTHTFLHLLLFSLTCINRAHKAPRLERCLLFTVAARKIEEGRASHPSDVLLLSGG